MHCKMFLNCALLSLFLMKLSLPLIEGTPLEMLPKDNAPASTIQQSNTDRVKVRVLQKQVKGEYIKYQVGWLRRHYCILQHLLCCSLNIKSCKCNTNGPVGKAVTWVGVLQPTFKTFFFFFFLQQMTWAMFQNELHSISLLAKNNLLGREKNIFRGVHNPSLTHM